MAVQGAEGIPTVDPGGGTSNVATFQKGAPDSEAFGSRLGATTAAAQERNARGLIEFGQGASVAGRFFGDVAADAATNEFTEQVQKVLYGDPQKMVKGPDGIDIPEPGYLSLKGRAALDARPGVEKQIDALMAKTRGTLLSPAEQLRFDQYSRRFRSFSGSEIGRHADRQTNLWATQVNTASAKTAMDHISYNYDNPEQVATGAHNLINAYVKIAELNGAKPGDPVWLEATAHGRRDALQAQLNAMAVKEPARALSILENPANREIAGAQYDNMANRFRARAYHETGTAIGDSLFIAGTPLANSGDTAGVVKHFEGFRTDAYQDNGGAFRIGYGSDTITKPDGTYITVKPGMTISREDAERDLARRLPQFQADARKNVGAEAWDALTPQAQASLTSIAYNYGTLAKPELSAVVAAAKGGDPTQIAGAIRGLSGHNGGINRNRRQQEAANITGASETGGRPSVRDQVEAMKEIDNMNAPPEVKASAQQALARKYAVYNAEATKTKAEFNETVKDTVAESMVHGTVQNPVTPDKFNMQYGDIQGPVEYRKYQADLQFGADYKSLETMSDREQGQLLTGRIPPPGSPGFEHQQKNYDRLQKAIVQMQDQRREDPAAAVLRNPVVNEAMKAFDPNKPETFQKVAAARLAAQELLGIEPDHQVPLTKKEALGMIAPLKRTLPGTPEQYAEMKNLAEQFKTMFGDNADKAFVYALRTQGKDQEVARQAAAAMKAIGMGQPVPPTVAKDLGTATELGAADRAVNGIPNAPAAIPGFGPVPGVSPTAPPAGAPRAVPGFGNIAPPPMSAEPSTWSQPVIPPAAINSLLADPTLAQDFNKKYGGAGVAEAILKKYGDVRVQKPVPLSKRIEASP